MPQKRSHLNQVVYDELITTFGIYDQHVDIVSAFEWLFTSPEVNSLPDTVLHFERFPKIGLPDGRRLTPDFTIYFNDQSALVFEIAQIARHDGSIEKLCKQLLSYSTLRNIPIAPNKIGAVSESTVVHLVPAVTGIEAVQRVIYERQRDPKHWYSPAKPPVIVQYFRNDQTYTFQRVPDPANGQIDDLQRNGIGSYFMKKSLNVSAAKFAATKAARAFVNDEIDALYLATHLWTRAWPNKYGSTPEISTSVTESVDLLREQQGVGRASDVRRALELLDLAGLALERPDKSWSVSRRLLGRSGDRDVHEIIARRAVSSRTKSSVQRHEDSSTGFQQSLF